jgi:error-prone DNA polymerase
LRAGSGYAHLHVRSGFSYGCGTATPEELVEAAADAGFRALALTDRDGLYGVPRFLKACGEVGLGATVGAEIALEPQSIGISGQSCAPLPRVVLLCESEEGYRNLCKLVSAYRLRCGPTAAERRNPSCDLTTLCEHAEGLVCLTGAVPFGLLPHLALGDTGFRGKRRRVLSLLREAFGERLYAELTDDRTHGSRRRMRATECAAKEAGISTLAAHEVTYLSPSDHRLHEALVAASNLTALPGPGYRPTDRLHLAPPEEMCRLFSDRPEALRSAAAVAERCAGAVELSGRLHLPAANLPRGEEPARRLTALAVAGAKEKYRVTKEVSASRIKARLLREVRCIASLGFADYFLIAHEAKEIAKEKGIPVTGRGSAANSMVAYCLGLTQPEPFSNRLLFERFLHEHRQDPPDIDLDLCSRRRDEVRDELMRRYERAGAAVAATAQTLSLRGAVRVAARALGHSPARIDELSRNVPRRASSWEEALSSPAMRRHPLQDRQQHRLLLELSAELRGRLQQPGTHLAGLVLGTPTRHLSELVPVEPSGKPNLLRVQYDKDDLEFCGIPKLDLLGLRMHTALFEAGQLASRISGERVDPFSPPPEDRPTFELIRSARTAGVFQLESPGQMSLSRRLKPRRFSDVVAQISLFRPGPIRGDLTTPYVMRRNAKEPYSVPLEELDEILRPTYGVLLYQEQVLEVAHRVAGFTLAEADQIRRAMTRDRGPEAMSGIREEFLRRTRKKGIPLRTAAEIFSWMECFASYGFSAAHAASFASLSYASAFMSCHHPAPYFCALLNAQPMGFYSPRVLLNEARRRGLKVLPPDLHASEDGFSVEEGGKALRVGLRYCQGLSRAAIDSILKERERRPFGSPQELYRRTAVSSDALANLIRAGFLDPMGEHSALLRSLSRLPKKPRGAGQKELPLPHPARPWEARELAGVRELPRSPAEGTYEREQRRVLGLDVLGHSLAPYREKLEALGVLLSEEILALPHGTRARAAGILESLQSPPTRSGRPVWFLLIEDERGLLQTTIFEGVYRHRGGHLLYREAAFLLEGTVEQDERRGFSFVVERIEALTEALRSVESRSAKGRRSRRAG